MSTTEWAHAWSPNKLEGLTTFIKPVVAKIDRWVLKLTKLVTNYTIKLIGVTTSATEKLSWFQSEHLSKVKNKNAWPSL
jgi:hypothetical protein